MAIVLVWIKMKSEMDNDIPLNLSKLRKGIFAIIILLVIILVPTLCLRLVPSITETMVILFNVLIVIFFSLMVILYCIFGWKLWWVARKIERSFFQKYGTHYKSVNQLMRVTSIVQITNVGLASLIISDAIWFAIDLYGYNPNITLLFQSILRLEEIFLVISFAGAVHPLRIVGLRGFFSIIFGPNDKGEQLSKTDTDISIQNMKDKYCFEY